LIKRSETSPINKMQTRKFSQQVALAGSFFHYLKHPLTLETATSKIRERIAQRECTFLSTTRKLIYENPSSPYRKMLHWAGCQYGDLEESVQQHGLEKTLAILQGEGVYLSQEEFKSQTPIGRNGLDIETTPPDFDNPFLMGRSIQGATSGSRSRSMRVHYDWNFLAEEAAHELLLYEEHGLGHSPSAFWLPALPSISGIHNLLLHMKFRRPPGKWYSHLPANLWSRTVMGFLACSSLVYGMKIPQPISARTSQALQVARWAEEVLRSHGTAVLKTFASSGIRVAQAARDEGIDLGGLTMFLGGEALTPARYQYLTETGVRPFGRYVATETGLIGAGCSCSQAPDTMHLYLDRLALIQQERRCRNTGATVSSFLFTTISPHTGKLLLNAELGDFGEVRAAPCPCRFGRIGMSILLSQVRSFDKLTGEGMSLLGSTLEEVLSELVLQAGGGPDDFQFWEEADDKGLTRLTIALSPRIPNVKEPQFREDILQRLKGKNSAGGIAAEFWQQAGTLEIVRAEPIISRGFKLIPVIKTKSSIDY